MNDFLMISNMSWVKHLNNNLIKKWEQAEVEKIIKESRS